MVPTSPRRILLIDDNQDAASMLAALLTARLGHVVEVANDGPSGLDLASDFQPEVVFFDLGLSRMDGYEVARRLRHNANFSSPMLVALTGSSGQDMRHKAKDAGFDHFLIKPPNLEEIEALLAPLSEQKDKASLMAYSPSVHSPGETERAQSKEATGAVLQGLAHELGNHLSPFQYLLRQMRSSSSEANMPVLWRELLETHLPPLLELLARLRQMSRVVTPSLHLNAFVLPLKDILSSAIMECQPLLHERGQKIAWGPPASSLCVKADPTQLQEAFVQLLTNAIEHTEPSESIAVSVDADERECWINIQDQGEGIASEWWPAIYEPFVRAEKTFDYRQGRLGMGLPLALKIITAHGGTLKGESSGPGQGSVFVVRLPRSSEPPSPLPTGI